MDLDCRDPDQCVVWSAPVSRPQDTRTGLTRDPPVLMKIHRFSHLNLKNILKATGPLNLLITKLAGPSGNSPVRTGGLAIKSIPDKI